MKSLVKIIKVIYLELAPSPVLSSMHAFHSNLDQFHTQKPHFVL